SAADSVMPDVNMTFGVSDGFISYPDLPENISNINIKTLVVVDGSNLDNTKVNLEQFHFELAGNPFDLSLSLKTPISDPEVTADFNGKLNIEALSQAVPMNLSEFRGIIDIALHLAGKMSMIENEDFDQFDAKGSINLSGFNIEMEGVPPVGIETARFEFSPQYAALENLKLVVAGNSINIKGRIENYLPYIFEDKTVVGRMSLYSPGIDLDTIVSYLPTDTSMVVKEDTVAVAMAVIRLPENIDFEFKSHIERFMFDPLDATNVRGNIILREGVLIIENTGLETLGGKIIIDAKYDSRDTLNPLVGGALSISDLGIKPAFDTFNTIRKLAPVAEGMDGDISVEFSFLGIVGEGMMPVLESINGKGRLISDEIQLVSSPVYKNLNKVLSLGDNFSNSLKDVDVEFTVKDGRVYIAPFDTRLGDMKVNISGDHGLDQTINYLMKSEIPFSKLPGSMKTMISGLAAQATLLGIKYEQPEIIRMNISIGGTVKDPVIKPSLAKVEGQTTVKEVAREAVKEVVDQKVEEVKEIVSDEAQKQADIILAEAEKQSQNIRDEAAKAALKIKDEAALNAQKLIDEAASKGAFAKIAANKGAEVLIKEGDNKADALELEAGKKADQIMETAKNKADEILKKI
ncbi:MAG: hypothetical protein K8R35_06465, partial [Bacteroidales bacterium]|nr:hypothetical protein [Bacteroidales bacterium]